MAPERKCEIFGVTLFLVEEFTHLALSCAIEPLRIANLLTGQELYRWRLASEDGKSARSSSGTVTLVDQGYEPVPPGDMLFFLSGLNVEQHISRELVAYVRRERARGTRIGALCSGALVLAEAGILDDQPAAIHWEFHDAFEERFPRIDLRRNVFITEGRHPMASGGTATADLMLSMIGDAHGVDLAVAIADQMLYNAVRDENGQQRMSIQARHGMRNAHVATAVKLMSDSIENPMTPSEVADRIGITPRQLERLFRRYMRCSPKRYSTDIRLHKARNLLTQTEHSITEIAHACGFGSSSQFTRVFRQRYGITPSLVRTRSGPL